MRPMKLSAAEEYGDGHKCDRISTNFRPIRKDFGSFYKPNKPCHAIVPLMLWTVRVTHSPEGFFLLSLLLWHVNLNTLFSPTSLSRGGFPQQELNLKFAGIKEEKERERAVESFIYLRWWVTLGSSHLSTAATKQNPPAWWLLGAPLPHPPPPPFLMPFSFLSLFLFLLSCTFGLCLISWNDAVKKR